tara:strand:- start:2480 stop:2974 length:495 start_codon:yes stop_codon:yes gene_type:complete
MLLIPISITHVYAQTLYIDAKVGDMDKIEESKYKATGVSIVRNENGELISTIRVDAARYLDDPIVDQFLESDPKYLIKKGVINNEKINLYEVKVEYYNPECLTVTFEVPGYIDPCNWYHRAFVTMLGLNDPDGEQHFAFKGLNHVYTLRSMDEVTTIWHILSKD